MILTIRGIIAVFFVIFCCEITSYYHISDINKEKIMNILYDSYFYCNDFFDFVNNILYSDFLYIDDSSSESSDEDSNVTVNKEIKYEEKYLEKVRTLNENGLFTEEDIELENNYISDLLRKNNDDYKEKIRELQEQINELEKEMKQIEDDDFKFLNSSDANETESDDSTDLLSKEERKQQKMEEISGLKSKIDDINKIINTPEGINNLMIQLNEMGRNYTIEKYTNKVKNNFIMENTPLGNVIMTHNNDRSVFEYYSDHNIPYRFLETVCRKFVLTFDCRPLYVDMEEELKEYEKKLAEKEKEQKERVKEQEEKPIQEVKKHVFAKFKSYNKEAGSGRVNMAPPPKNSIPNNKIKSTNENEKILLKEHANRYSYQGKIANFSFLKKIDRKIVDKKFALTFSEYKKQMSSKKSGI